MVPRLDRLGACTSRSDRNMAERITMCDRVFLQVAPRRRRPQGELTQTTVCAVQGTHQDPYWASGAPPRTSSTTGRRRVPTRARAGFLAMPPRCLVGLGETNPTSLGN